LFWELSLHATSSFAASNMRGTMCSMERQGAIVVSGVGPSSLGAGVVSTLRETNPSSRFIIVDKQYNPSFAGIPGITSAVLDLNPFTSKQGYDGIASVLNITIEQAVHELQVDGIATIILAAGTYESGALLDTTLAGRQRLIGVNICGKIELLYAALTLNKKLIFDNSESFTLIDVGTLPSLVTSSRRTVYSATKATGLDLCVSMNRGNEISRAIYLALGPVDTHMLHRNHWVSKEHGPLDFFEYVYTQDDDFYQDVFVHCDDAAFAKAASATKWNSIELKEVFERYKVLRKKQFADKYGVLSVEYLSKCIGEIVIDCDSHISGMYIFTAPGGQMRMQYMPFSEVMKCDMG
jgi:hypothetical protein